MKPQQPLGRATKHLGSADRGFYCAAQHANRKGWKGCDNGPARGCWLTWRTYGLIFNGEQERRVANTHRQQPSIICRKPPLFEDGTGCTVRVVRQQHASRRLAAAFFQERVHGFVLDAIEHKPARSIVA